MILRRLTPILLLIVALGSSACGTADRSASTTEGATPSPGPVTLAADASPEEVRQAVLAALENIGPVRVEATVTADTGDLTNERHAVQLLDPVSGLARETITSSRGGPEEASVIGNESVRVMGEGANVQVIRSVQLRPPTGLPLPLYELSPLFLEDAQAISASLKDDGSWELVLRPQITAREAQMMAGDLGDLLIVVGPDLLPRRTERTIHYSTGGGTAEPDGTTSTWQSEQTSIERVEYRIEPIDGLEEQDVRLTLPQDYRVVQLSTELALDPPRADVAWPQYWLGPQFLDLKLNNAAIVVGDPDETTRSEHTMSVYGSSGQPPWEQSIQLITNKRQTRRAGRLGADDGAPASGGHHRGDDGRGENGYGPYPRRLDPRRGLRRSDRLPRRDRADHGSRPPPGGG